MSEVISKRLDEIEAYSGKSAIAGIHFRPAGRALGVTAWGMNVLEIDAGCVGYPEHDHLKDGQEEVYTLLLGTATMHCAGQELPMEVGRLIRVPPDQKRKIIPGPQGCTVLALGATPGKAYEPRR